MPLCWSTSGGNPDTRQLLCRAHTDKRALWFPLLSPFSLLLSKLLTGVVRPGCQSSPLFEVEP